MFDNVWQQLGLTLPNAELNIKNSILQGSLYYYGAKNAKVTEIAVTQAAANTNEKLTTKSEIFTESDLKQFNATGIIPGGHIIQYKSDSATLINGNIVAINPKIVYAKKAEGSVTEKIRKWSTENNWANLFYTAFTDALRAIVPLCLFLFIMMRFVVREKIPRSDEILFGIFLAVIGFAVFGIGLTLGLTSLGSQLGSNIPSAFTKIQLWKLDSMYGPMFNETSGKIVAIIFGFFESNIRFILNLINKQIKFYFILLFY